MNNVNTNMIFTITVSVILSISLTLCSIMFIPTVKDALRGPEGPQGQTGSQGPIGPQGKPGDPGKSILIIYEKGVSLGYGFVVNGGLEERYTERPWMPIGWDGGGTIGSDAGYDGVGVALHSWSINHGSDIYQEISIDTTYVVLAFWIKSNPRSEQITLQVYFDSEIVYSATFTESNDWTLIVREINTFKGSHVLRFSVVPFKDYDQGQTPYIVIDEVSLIG